MKKSTKLISLLLAVLMVVALLPAAALADSSDSEDVSTASTLTDIIGSVTDLINGVTIPDYLVYCSLATGLPASNAQITLTKNGILGGDSTVVTANALGLALISKTLLGTYSVSATYTGTITGISYKTLPGINWTVGAMPDADVLVLYPVLNIGLNFTDHFAYLIGCDDGNVQPLRSITRAEVATILFRLMTEDSREQYMTKTNSFPDVNEGDWYNTAISTLANAGIVEGGDDGNFQPTKAITRGEFAAMIARLFSVEFTNTTLFNNINLFDDINTHWAKNYINLLGLLGIIKGNGGSARPDDALTRAEAATMINRLLGRVASASSADACTGDVVTFPDNADTSAWYYADILEATNSHNYTWTFNISNIDITDIKNTIGKTVAEQWTAIRTDCPDWAEIEK